MSGTECDPPLRAKAGEINGKLAGTINKEINKCSATSGKYLSLLKYNALSAIKYSLEHEVAQKLFMSWCIWRIAWIQQGKNALRSPKKEDGKVVW